MPNLRLTNLAAYRTYFEGLATSHVDIDGFKWGEKDVIKNDNRSDVAERFLWATPYDNARYLDRNSDNIVKVKLARVAYLIVPDSELYADEDEAFDFCEGVIEQILARILKDKRGEEVEGVWTMIATEVTGWKTGPVVHKVGSTKYIGWEMEVSFMDNTDMAYNPAKWA